MKEMVGGCCVCSDDSGWPENPLVYCDGPNCTVAVHQACYGIVTVPAGNWFCRKCESPEGNVKVRCELCPNKEGALKPTDNSGWAHVVCALYIPEVRFGNVTTMEPIILAQIPPERYNKTCDICEKNFRGSGRAKVGACMQCNKPGCRVQFHVTCAQSQGLLCEEAGNNTDNVKYCGYCQHHYTKLKKGAHVKVILPYRPITNSYSPEGSPVKEIEPVKTTSKRKLSTSSSSKGSGLGASGGGAGGDDLCTNDEDSQCSNKTSGGLDSDLKLMPGKRKKGSRTPPVSGASPEASPRPVTPLNSSTSSANSSTGPSSLLLNVSSVVVAPPSLLAVPPPPPVSSPSGVVVQPSSTPHRQSTTPPPILTNSTNPSTQDVKKTGQSNLVKECRPNSIVVNVPLEVALPTAASANASERRTPPRIDASAPIPSPLLPTVQLEDINHVTGTVGSQSHSHHSSAPSKRPRSQSGDKSDKSRRSSKRNSGSGGTSSNKTMSSSPPRSSHSSREKSDGSGHHNHHSGGGSSGSHHHHGGYSSDSIKSSGRRHHSSSSSTSHSTTTTTSNSNSSSLSTNHLSHQQPGGSASANLNQHLVHIPVSTPSSAINNIAIHGSSSNSAAGVPNKEDKPDLKILSSTNVNVPHMLGNTLNPSSTMAQKMCDTLSQEIVAHSVYNSAANGSSSNPLVGPQLPHRANATAANSLSSASTTGTNNNNNIWMSASSTPQSLEQLLERQWEQGSQFLMEQAQHFDIASLLSCLHQLRAENAQLEDHVNSLIQRRDHLLAVNARLAIPLVPPATSAAPSNGSQPINPTTQPIVENGLPPSVSPHEAPYRGSSTIRQHPSGGGGGGGGGGGTGASASLPSVNNPVFNSNPGQQNSVLVRASSSDSRRSSQSPAAAGPYGQIYQQSAHLNQSQERNSVGFLIHPRCSMNKLGIYGYDLAVALMKKPFSFNSKVLPSRFLGNEAQSVKKQLGKFTEERKSCQVASWTPEGNASVLRLTQLRMMPESECAAVFCATNDTFCSREFIRLESQMCACGRLTSFDEDCSIVSGSPFFCQNTLMGLVSYGEIGGCRVLECQPIVVVRSDVVVAWKFEFPKTVRARILYRATSGARAEVLLSSFVSAFLVIYRLIPSFYVEIMPTEPFAPPPSSIRGCFPIGTPENPKHCETKSPNSCGTPSFTPYRPRIPI